MVTRVRNVNPLQFAIVYGAVAAVLGFIVAVLWLPFGAIMAAMPGARGAGFGFGIFAIIIFPIFYFIAGFVVGLIGAAVYNLVAGWTGGVEVTLSGAPVESAPTTSGYTV